MKGEIWLYSLYIKVTLPGFSAFNYKGYLQMLSESLSSIERYLAPPISIHKLYRLPGTLAYI